VKLGKNSSDTCAFLGGMNISEKDSMLKSQTKRMLITSFNIKGILHFDFTPQGQTVNQAYYYVEILKQLCDAVLIKSPELWPND
jgi:hypothetical protein